MGQDRYGTRNRAGRTGASTSRKVAHQAKLLPGQTAKLIGDRGKLTWPPPSLAFRSRGKNAVPRHTAAPRRGRLHGQFRYVDWQSARDRGLRLRRSQVGKLTLKAEAGGRR